MQITGRMPVAGLRALLGSSLDYAGLFPPASLPLEAAIKNYAKYRIGPDAWLLGRFVCPVDRLAQLDPYLPLFAESAPLAISALALPSASWELTVRKLSESLFLILRFVRQRHHLPLMRVDSIEITLPADWTDLGPGLFLAAADVIERTGLAEISPFFEVTAADWETQAELTIRDIASHNSEWNGVRCRPAAFKLRTGGVKAEAFPSVHQVALAVRTCLDAGVRFKCTAGLHHPVRLYDQSLQTKMHGFLNVFGAAALLHAQVLEPSDFRSILEDENPSHFRLDEDGFAWNGLRATVEQISEARKSLIVSFGSCSFEEPLEDLRKLGM